MSDSDILEKRVRYLLSIGQGLSTLYGGYRGRYRDGFLRAVVLWNTASDSQEAFRRVVEAKQNGMLDGNSDEFVRGYDDALRLFQEAKSL